MLGTPPRPHSARVARLLRVTTPELSHCTHWGQGYPRSQH